MRICNSCAHGVASEDGSVPPGHLTCFGVPPTPVGVPAQVPTPKELLLQNPNLGPVMNMIQFRMQDAVVSEGRRACGLYRERHDNPPQVY